MDIKIIINAVKPNASTSPRKRAGFPNYTLHFAHEIIQKSQYREVLSRWHWAILDEIKPYYNPEKDTAEAENREKNAVALVEGVWNKYYAGNEDTTRNKKRKIDEVYADDEEGLDGSPKKRRAGVSIKGIADSGWSFKLDWESTDENVAVFNGEDGDMKMIDSGLLPVTPKKGKETAGGSQEGEGDGGSPDGKENQRPISSPHSLRKRLLRKLMAAAGVV
ncbi:hypothetical protein TWF481_000504 [Arthrobotrys musiformis]|uniref:Uncharacterized protein n=1 Tax=Arthrobotrys musiformis TaxID=47236 RepID=A0AAV9WMT2_9PEZI